MYTLMTNDVEEVSIVNNNLSYKTAKKVTEEGLPLLLDIYSKYDVEGTFYFTGTFAKNFPESVQSVVDSGHEVGCHGFSHNPSHAFDALSMKSQYQHIKRAKKTIEDIAGRIESFRTPALRIGNDTVTVLEKTGFKSDSSVAPQRFDGPLSFGSLRKLNWLLSPRKPYMLSYNTPYSVGQSSVLEIPVSAFIFSYQGTTMRAAPNLCEIIGNFHRKESLCTNKPIVFIFHPNELISEKRTSTINRRSKNFASYLFGDIIRRKIKLRNLGYNAGKLLAKELKKCKDAGFEFVSARKFRKQWSQSIN